jgi:chromosome segregation ATPase
MSNIRNSEPDNEGLASMTVEFEEAKRAAGQTTIRIADLESQISQKEAEISKHKDTIQRLVTKAQEASRLHAELAEARKMADVAKKEKSELLGAMPGLEGKITSQREEFEKLLAEAKKLQAEKDQLSRDKEAASKEMEKEREHNEKLMKDMYNNAKSDKAREFLDLQQKLDQQQAELASYKSKYEIAAGRESELDKAVAGLWDEIDNIKAENASKMFQMRKQVMENVLETEQKDKAHKDLKNSEMEARKELQTSLQVNAELSAQILDLAGKLAESQKSVDDLKKELANSKKATPPPPPVPAISPAQQEFNRKLVSFKKHDQPGKEAVLIKRTVDLIKGILEDTGTKRKGRRTPEENQTKRSASVKKKSELNTKPWTPTT